jgi:hypothetical protein
MTAAPIPTRGLKIPDNKPLLKRGFQKCIGLSHDDRRKRLLLQLEVARMSHCCGQEKDPLFTTETILPYKTIATPKSASWWGPRGLLLIVKPGL